jgi:PAS domain-containing protein
MEAGANVSKSAFEDERPMHFKICKNGIEIPPSELPLRLAGKGEHIWNQEMEILFDDGESRLMLGNAGPLRDASGEVYGAVGVFLDITDRRSPAA